MSGAALQEIKDSLRELYQADARPWLVGFSGGKDSTLVASLSRNNDPRNGLALSKNAHWQFDRGLWSVSDDYRVVVNRQKFIEEGIPGQKLVDFDGHRLFLPSDPKYWPDQKHIAWHRSRHGT
ncbi:MAG: HNH endonuclease [Verrucomicrobiota bacterium]|jgi:hypothetical protein